MKNIDTEEIKKRIYNFSRNIEYQLLESNIIIGGKMMSCISNRYAAVGYNVPIPNGMNMFTIYILDNSPQPLDQFSLYLANHTITNYRKESILNAELIKFNIVGDEVIYITIKRPSGTIQTITYAIRNGKIADSDILFVSNRIEMI